MRNVRRGLAVVLALVMLLPSILIPGMAAGKYQDVPDSSWYSAAVEYVTEKGYMAGVSEDSFAPNTPVTRAMFVTVLAKVAGVKGLDDTASVFSDVPAGKWYTGSVAWAAQNGIVSGVSATEFAPNRKITRQDMCVILSKFVQVMEYELPQNGAASFNDAATISSYARGAVAECTAANLIAGFSDGTFRPKGTATRAQIAVIIMRLAELLEGKPVDPVPMPAQEFNGAAGEDMTVAVNAPEGALPENTNMTVSRVTDEAALAAISEKTGAKVYAAADITFTKDGAELEPEKAVEVQISLDGLENLKNPTVYHVNADGSVDYVAAEIVSATRGSEKVLRFYASEFSVYAIGDNGATVKTLTVNFYDKDGEIVSGQVIRLDQLDEYIAKNMDFVHDPGVPTITDTQSFEGWADKQAYTEEDTGYSVADINEKIKTEKAALAAATADQTWNYYAKVYEVVFVTFHDQDGVVIRLESIHLDSTTLKGDYTVNLSYTPFKGGWAHIGWTPTINNTGDTPTYPDSPVVYENGDTIDLTASIDLYPYLKQGYWLMFDNYIEQDDDATSASFTSPRYYGKDESAALPTDYGDANNDGVDHDTEPYRVGYTFGGWYTDKSFTTPYTARQLTADTTVYAKWTPRTDTKYTVVIWTQRADNAWDAANDEKTYDFYEAIDTRKGTTGQVANFLPADTQMGGTAGTELGYYYTYNATNSDTDGVTIKGDGTTVVNVYYDRRVITINFYRSGTPNSSYTSVTYGTLYDSIKGLYEGEIEQWIAPPTSGYVWHYIYNRDEYYFQDAAAPKNYIPWVPNVDTWNLYQASVTTYSYHKTLNYMLQDTDGEYKLDHTYNIDYTNSSNYVTVNFDGTEYFGFTGVGYNCQQNSMNTSEGYQTFTAVSGNYIGVDYSDVTGSNAYVYYARNKHDLSFFSNGDLLTDISKSVYYDASLSGYEPAAAPTNGPAGYFFDGWYKDPGCTEPFDWTDNMPNNNVAVYAKWTLMRFRVTLDYTGGDTSAVVEFPANQASTFRVDYGEKVRDTAIIAATREGYTLLGWYLDPNGEHPFNFAEAITDQTYNMDLTYKDAPDSERVGKDAVTGNNWTDVGRTNMVGKVTIYAVWRKNPIGSDGVRVRYDAIKDDGYFPVNGEKTDPRVIIRDDPKVYTDAAKAFAQVASTPEDDENYRFLYWVVMQPVKDAQGNVVMENGEPKLEPTTIKVYPGQTFTVDYDYTVQVEAVKVKWIFKDADGDEDLTDTTTVTKGAVPTHSKPSGYVSGSSYYPVVGWKTDDTHIYYYDGENHTGTNVELPAVSENTTFTAVYGEPEAVSQHQFTVTWKNWDGTTLETQTYTAGQTPSYPNAAPTRPDDSDYTYTFSGWTPAVTVVSGDATYTATYTAADRQYQITFYANSASGGSFTDGTTKTVTATKGTLYRDIFPDNPTNSTSGRYFFGWFTAANGGTEVAGTDEFDGTVTELYAHWYTATWERDTSGTIVDGDYYCFCTYSNSTYYWVTNAGNNSYLTRTSSTSNIPTGAMWRAQEYSTNTSYHYLVNTLNDSDYMLMETQSSPYPAVAVNDDATISTYYVRVQLVETSTSGMYYLYNSYGEYLYYSTSYSSYNYIWSEDNATSFRVYHFVYEDINAEGTSAAGDEKMGGAAEQLVAENAPALNTGKTASIAGFDKPETSAAPAATRGNTNPVKATNSLLTEGFEGTSLTKTNTATDSLGSGWTVYNGNSIATTSEYGWWSAYQAGSTGTHGGSFAARYYYHSSYAADCYLISPAFTVSSNATKIDLQLYAKSQTTTYPEKFDVFFVDASQITTAGGVKTATAGNGKYVSLGETTVSSTTWTEYNGTSVTGLAGKSVRLVIHACSEADKYYLWVDDVAVTETIPDTPSYTITWNYKASNGDDASITSTVQEGDTPTAPDVPETYTLNGTTYAFTGWDKTIVAATEATTYTAQYSVQSYTITWRYKDSTGADTSTTTEVAPGATPEPGFTPASYTSGGDEYRFTGWTPTIAAATGPATYTAQYTDVSYTITWHIKTDGGNWTTVTTSVAEGNVPSYNSHPVWEDENGDEWMFSAWNSAQDGSGTAPVAATANTDYWAQYTKVGVYTYTMYLYAVYGLYNKSGTHVTWFGNNDPTEATAGVQIERDKGMQVNVGYPIPVPAAFVNGVKDYAGDSTQSNPTTTTLTYEDHVFLGWARLEADPNDTANAGSAHPDLTEDDLYLKWDAASGKYYLNTNAGNAGAPVWSTDLYTNIAADEMSPYHDMYAVWATYAYVFHSSSGKIEAIEITKTKSGTSVTTDTVNLVDMVPTGYLYGGYYTTYGGAKDILSKADYVEQGGSMVVNTGSMRDYKNQALQKSSAADPMVQTSAATYNGSAIKNGDTRFWTKAKAYGYGDQSEAPSGDHLIPTAGTVYYLKEVPETYLTTKYLYTYETMEGENEGVIQNFFMLTVMDDAFYKEIGFRTVEGAETVRDATNADITPRTAIASKFEVIQRGNGIAGHPRCNDTVVTVDPSSFGLTRGYIAVTQADALITEEAGKSFTVMPAWETLDGVEVNSHGTLKLDVSSDKKTIDYELLGNVPVSYTTIYAELSEVTWWASSDAKTMVYFYGDSENTWVPATVSGTNQLMFKIPDGNWNGFNIVRGKADYTGSDYWSKANEGGFMWNQTENVSLNRSKNQVKIYDGKNDYGNNGCAYIANLNP